ncbi:unnamed protein product [Effrenium voratum]|uniref:Uncharacterized protein n=1 Tax=Effrenium voratum TaxID=2562239 RepID=A0AA36J0D0_9DINO|nr:unnamed protein product [Effrenium voratum]CAJ1412473.1 unnamed protein product [Effrenium voratum]CAJ1451396.1 unnamed protein product [Effrenium voratum]
MLRAALAFNGALMLLWSPVLFFNMEMMWKAMEGRKAAQAKTAFDVMIWRICALWVACTGLVCLFASDVPSGFWTARWGVEPALLEAVRRPLGWLCVCMHGIEVCVKYAAVGAKVTQAASGNVVLAGCILVALLLE